MEIQTYSKYLKAEDGFVDGESKEFTITNVTEETIGQGDKAERKYVLHLAETERMFTLNTTNLNILLSLFGKESDNWLDKKIKVKREKTTFGAKIVPCLRIQLN